MTFLGIPIPDFSCEGIPADVQPPQRFQQLLNPILVPLKLSQSCGYPGNFLGFTLGTSQAAQIPNPPHWEHQGGGKTPGSGVGMGASQEKPSKNTLKQLPAEF